MFFERRDRLAEVQEECEEREKRWNRIASLLDRDDLTSNLSSSSTSMATTQYLSTSTNASLNNGVTQNPSTGIDRFLHLQRTVFLCS